jgi:hypothetical protein
MSAISFWALKRMKAFGFHVGQFFGRDIGTLFDRSNPAGTCTFSGGSFQSARSGNTLRNFAGTVSGPKSRLRSKYERKESCTIALSFEKRME